MRVVSALALVLVSTHWSIDVSSFFKKRIRYLRSVVFTILGCFILVLCMTLVGAMNCAGT